jgi:hypothetical protein
MSSVAERITNVTLGESKRPRNLGHVMLDLLGDGGAGGA